MRVQNAQFEIVADFWGNERKLQTIGEVPRGAVKKPTPLEPWPVSLEASARQLGEFSPFSRVTKNVGRNGWKRGYRSDCVDDRSTTFRGGRDCKREGGVYTYGEHSTSYARYVEGVRDRLMWPRHRSNKASHNGRTPGTLDGWIAGVVMFRGGRKGARRHRRKGAWLRWIYYPPLAAITNEIQCAITYVRHAKVLSVSRLYSTL